MVKTDEFSRPLLPEELIGRVTDILIGQKDGLTLFIGIDSEPNKIIVPTGTVLVRFVPIDKAQTIAPGKGEVDLYGIAESTDQSLVGQFTVISRKTAEQNLRKLSDEQVAELTPQANTEL